MHKKQNYQIVIFSVLVALMLVTGCSTSQQSSTENGVGVVTETTMTDTVESSGSISARQLATLTWGTSGNVAEVNIANNDHVTSGDILMTLDVTSVPSEINLAISSLLTAQQELINAKDSKTALAKAEVTLNDAQVAYNDVLSKSYTLDGPRSSEDYMAILNANMVKAENAVDKAEENYQQVANLDDTDSRKVNSLATLAQARIDLKKAIASYNYGASSPSGTDAAAIKGNLELAKAQLEDAQRAYDLLKSGDNTAAIQTAQAAVDSAQATVNKMSIIAPFSGDIAVIYSQVGDVVSNGTQALVVVDRSKLYVDVLVDETSISTVTVGDPATITFDALDDALATTGQVTLIDPIGQVASGVVNYTVRVELDQADPAILIGATATVVIQTGDPQSTLFVPVSAVLSDAQGEYVMRIMSDGSTERVTVISGQIVDTTVIVSGNLQKGDRVQLFSSSSSSTTTNDENRNGFSSGMISNGGAGGPPGQMP